MSGFDRQVNSDGDTVADLIENRLDRIADALETIAARPPKRQFIAIHLPAEFTAGEAKDVMARLVDLMKEPA